MPPQNLYKMECTIDIKKILFVCLFVFLYYSIIFTHLHPYLHSLRDLYTLQKWFGLPAATVQPSAHVSHCLVVSLFALLQFPIKSSCREENCSGQNWSILFFLTLLWPFYAIKESWESEDLLAVALLLSKDFIYGKWIYQLTNKSSCHSQCMLEELVIVFWRGFFFQSKPIFDTWTMSFFWRWK